MYIKKKLNIRCSIGIWMLHLKMTEKKDIKFYFTETKQNLLCAERD